MSEARILVLCVDRDNDVGRRLNVKTPIVGRDNLVRIGLEYITQYPDDSDANAIFGAVKIYDSLKPIYGDNIEVALVTGSDGEEADLKVTAELDKVLSTFNATGIILVSDGPSDELVLPLIQMRRPVISVRRIIVKQSRGVEDFAVLSRYYIKKAFTEPEWRRYTFGIPGIILILYGIWLLIPQFIKPMVATTLSLVLGASFMVIALNWYRPLVMFIKYHEATFFTTLVTLGIVIFYASLYVYVFKGNLMDIMLGNPLTLPEIVGILYAALITIYVLETYSRTRHILYSHIASIAFITPLTFLSTILAWGLNIEALLLFLIFYIAFNVAVLSIILAVRRYERRRRLR